MNRMRVIGSGGRFADEWQWAMKNLDPFFTPVPTEQMSTEQLMSIKKTLTDLVDYWTNQVYSNTNDEAIANSQAISDLEQSKLNAVNAILDKRLPVTTANGGTVPQMEVTDGTKKSWLPILAIAAVAFYFFTKKRRA